MPSVKIVENIVIFVTATTNVTEHHVVSF